jgi:hypothetical protein
MKKLQILLVASLIFALVACEPTINTPVGTKKLGTLGADNTSLVYVAIGTSMSAGTQSYACFAEATKYSFPNLFAGQMGVSTFVQPDYAEPGLGLRYMLRGFTSAGLPILDMVQLAGGVTNSNYAKPYNNLGIWGAIAYDLIDTSNFAARGVARENPYYVPVLRNPQLGASMVDQAISLAPNLITFEMGANDVLGYAKSGGAISTTIVNGEPIPTPVASMEQIFTGALMKLTTALPNTKIILFTVPNVLGVPFFKTVPWNALLIDGATATKLNAAYGQLGFTFAAGANGFVAESPKSPGKLRQLTAEDYLLLSVPQSELAKGMGSIKPIPNQYVLDKFEATIVSRTVTEYNSMIRGLTAISKNNNIIIFDLDQMLTNVINNGYAVPGGTTMTNKFISGEMFSLDGFHPTSRGQGAIANELIKFINLTFGADIPLVNLPSLPPNYVNP